MLLQQSHTAFFQLFCTAGQLGYPCVSGGKAQTEVLLHAVLLTLPCPRQGEAGFCIEPRQTGGVDVIHKGVEDKRSFFGLLLGEGLVLGVF